MKTYAGGSDFGNGDTKAVAVIGGVQYRISNPTAFCRIDIAAMQSLHYAEDDNANKEEEKPTTKRGKATKKATPPMVVEGADPNKPPALEPQKVIIQLEGESSAYAFGHYALAQEGETWNGNDDPLRYASKYALRATLASFALLVPDTEFGLLLVTGVPAKLYIKYPELRGKIKEALDGEHRFTLDGTQRCITIEVATVVMEGAGALLAYPGITKTTEAGVIDIGSGTTDLYAQSGATPIIPFCDGRDIATSRAAAMLRKTFAFKEKRDLTDKETRKIMHAFASGKLSEYPEVNVFGKPVAAQVLRDLLDDAIEAIGADIATFIVKTWKDGVSRLNPIVLIGGGSLYFYPAIRNRIEHVVLHHDPVYANPIGYATLAARRLIAKRQQIAAAQQTVVGD